MTYDFESALNAFLATLPKLLEKNRPDLSPELRTLLISLVSQAFYGLGIVLANGPERVKAARLIFDLCGLGSSRDSSDKASED